MTVVLATTILLFAAGSEALIQEIYCLPAIETKGGERVPAVKLGVPTGSKDGRFAFSHNFHPAQLEWIAFYAPEVEVVYELPKDWEPLDEGDPAPTLGDLELTTKPADPGATVEPDDKQQWARPATKGEQDAQREVRKQQWQMLLPAKEFEP